MPDEVIVVDNNSTDDTTQIAKSYPFVKVIKEPKQGIVEARNCGFNAVKSTIIGRIDADSVLPNNWVEKILSFYSFPVHDNYAWTSEGYYYNIRLPKVNSWVNSQIAFRLNRFILGHYILWGSTMAITKKQWDRVKNETCNRQDIHEDLDLAIHLHRMGVQITYDTSVKVAVNMKRVLTDRHVLWQYLKWWPQTLRVHKRKAWILGYIGAVFLYLGSPVLVMNDKVAKLSKDKLLKKLNVR